MSFHKSIVWKGLRLRAQSTNTTGAGLPSPRSGKCVMHTAPKSTVPILDIAASIRFIIPPVEEELAPKQEARVSAYPSRLSCAGLRTKHGDLSTSFLRKVFRTYTEGSGPKARTHKPGGFPTRASVLPGVGVKSPVRKLRTGGRMPPQPAGCLRYRVAHASSVRVNEASSFETLRGEFSNGRQPSRG